MKRKKTPTLERLFAGALEVLKDRRNWTKGAFARSSCHRRSISVPLFDPRAQAYCLAGSLMKVAGKDPKRKVVTSFGYRHRAQVDKAERFLQQIIRGRTQDPFTTVTSWNDDRKRRHAEVVGLLREARGQAKR